MLVVYAICFSMCMLTVTLIERRQTISQTLHLSKHKGWLQLGQLGLVALFLLRPNVFTLRSPAISALLIVASVGIFLFHHNHALHYLSACTYLAVTAVVLVLSTKIHWVAWMVIFAGVVATGWHHVGAGEALYLVVVSLCLVNN